MALQTVNVYVMNDAPVPTPVESVTVRVFLIDDTTLVTEAITDPAGIATMTLDDVNPSYLLRFYKLGFRVTQPTSLLMTPPFPLSVNIYGTEFLPERPVATDPQWCRISGYLRDQFGNFRPKQRLKLRPIRDPAIYQGPQALVRDGDYDIVTDTNGWVSFDLRRGAVMEALISGWIDEPLCVEVPDRSWLDLVDLVFPTPALIALGPNDPVPPLLVQLNGVLVLEPRVLLSNDIWLADNLMGYDTAILGAESDNVAIVAVTSSAEFNSGSQLSLSGVALGVANVTLESLRVDDYFAKRNPPLVVTPLTVQVFVVV